MTSPWSLAATALRLCLLPALALAPVACGRDRKPAEGGAGAPARPAAPEEVVMDKPTVEPPPPSRWSITTGRVGELALDAPVPSVLLTDALAAAYQPRFIADGVPEDAFRLVEPPLTFAIADGPFALLDRKGTPTPPPVDVLRPKAVAAAGAGALVIAIRVHGPGPVTAAGIGVGSTLAQVRAAYQHVRLNPLPPTVDDREGDGCVARSADLPGVSFVFANCKAAEDGARVKRVDLWSTR